MRFGRVKLQEPLPTHWNCSASARGEGFQTKSHHWVAGTKSLPAPAGTARAAGARTRLCSRVSLSQINLA